MAVKVRKPILVAGLGFSVALWLWGSLHNQIVFLGERGMFAAIALGAAFWWLQQQTAKTSLSPSKWIPLKRETVKEAIAQAEAVIPLLEKEAPERDISGLKQQITQLSTAKTGKNLQIAVTGGKKVGKTCLKHLLESHKISENLRFVETESLLSERESTGNIAKEVALGSDLALFLLNGDLTASEWQILQEFSTLHQRVILLLNKQDQYISEERSLILQEVRKRVANIIPPEEVMSIAAAPNSVKVRQYQEDGAVQEWMEQQTPEITELRDRLKNILTEEREDLIWGTIWRRAVGLKQQGKGILNEVRRDRAIPVIEQYQWIAATAALANPVAALDLVATAAVNTQMIVDLSGIYQQKLSLAQGKRIGGTMGQLMVKLGLVELSTQTIGSLLKSNAFTYLAGGAVQGVSVAYLTRLAGLSLIEYFQEQELSISSGEGLNLEKLGTKLKQVFEENQRAAFLQGFVKQTVARLSFS